MEMDEIKQKVLEDVDPPTRRAKRKRTRQDWIRTFLEFAVIILLIFLVFQFIWGISTVEGSSMYPTLHDENIVVYSRVDKSYEQGQIIVIDRPGGDIFVKRIVAVAGDTVNIEGGNLYVNGKEIRLDTTIGETREAADALDYPVVVAEGEVFVLGDNRENSEDSRMFGPIKLEDVKGKILWYMGEVK